jgi:hypothetical protein
MARFIDMGSVVGFQSLLRLSSHLPRLERLIKAYRDTFESYLSTTAFQ